MRHGGVRALILVGLGAILASSPAGAQLPFGEQNYEYELADVLSDASSFERVDEPPYWRGYADEEQQQLVGYVFLTDELVDIPGYSGETMNTLVGMDTAGTITGVKIVHHSEPIVLIGLHESVIHAFTGQYTGKSIADSILISNEPKEGHVVVDAISGGDGHRGRRERDRARGGSTHRPRRRNPERGRHSLATSEHGFPRILLARARIPGRHRLDYGRFW